MINVLDEFINYLESRDLSPLTLKGYHSDLAKFSRWFEQTNGESMALAGVTPTDVKEYRQHLLGVEHRTASTVNRNLAALSSLMHWALEEERISSDPTRNLKMVRTVAGAPRWLDKREQFCLQRAIEKDLQLSKMRYPKRWITRRRDASLVQFLLHTGLRLSEATALQTSDVQLSERKGSVLVRNGKGGKQRNVPLNLEARKALEEWTAVRSESKYLWTAVEGEGEEDGALSGRGVQRILKRYAQEAGLEDLTPHVCRHTFAKNLMDRGVGIEKVAMLLGHTNLNTTRIYITPSEHDLELAVEDQAN
jgi:site-specific recombinase XerD